MQDSRGTVHFDDAFDLARPRTRNNTTTANDKAVAWFKRNSMLDHSLGHNAFIVLYKTIFTLCSGC